LDGQKVMLAEKTLAAIDAALEKDGGARFRGLQKQAFSELTDAFSIKEEGFRKHLGASLIGRPCARALWYGWHWCKKSFHNGKTLRLFNRGHLEEARFIALLRLIGCQVWGVTDEGHQLRISGVNGHFGGSLDAVVLGVPDDPFNPYLAEFKTHGDKSFAGLVSEGVMKAKWEHYVQMNMYASAHNLDRWLYMAVNKNTDALYLETGFIDPPVVARYWQRAKDIIEAPEPPDKINTSPAWYQCKYCEYHKMCHDFEYPEVNCRTCAHSTPTENGKWTCEKTNTEIPPSMEACSSHIFNPSILNGVEVLQANMAENWMVYKRKDGITVDTREK
jgi:hypothetical protein